MFRFELAMRKSTNAVTGCFRFISASGKNVPAEAVVSGIYDVRLENSVLKVSESDVYKRQPYISGTTMVNYATMPMTVDVGGATIFVINVDRYEKI